MRDELNKNIDERVQDRLGDPECLRSDKKLNQYSPKCKMKPGGV